MVGKFVEFYGEGLKNLSLADRATIANMAPEYGATCGFFPIDDETLRYLKFSGRDQSTVKIVEEYAKTQGLWSSNEIEFTDTFILDMSTSKINRGKIRRAQKLGLKIPYGVALNKNGKITTNAHHAIGGTQLPIAGFKGSGLAWMVDILSLIHI